MTTRDLDIARELIEAGVPIFLARPDMQDGDWDPTGGHGRTGYWLPKGWETTKPDSRVLEHYRDGMALCAVMVGPVNVLDVDPRNGGDASRAALEQAGLWPTSYGTIATPSGGTHDYVRALGCGKGTPVAGIDLQASSSDGSSAGFVFLPPTKRASKVDGEIRAYEWTAPLMLDEIDPADDSGDGIRDLIQGVQRSHTPENAESPQTPPEQRTGVNAALWQSYTDAAVTGVCDDLRASASWPVGYQPTPGHGWDRQQADAALRLASLAKAEWCPLTEAQAYAAFTAAAPTDSTWTARDVAEKWAHKWKVARPAAMPPERKITTVTELVGVTESRITESGNTQIVQNSESPALGSTWSPLDLADTVHGLLTGTVQRHKPTVGQLGNGQALFYPGKVNGLAGASNTGKSWTALVCCAQEITSGRHVVYIDLEDDQVSVIGRLIDAGADPEDILARFCYIRADEAFTDAAASALYATLSAVTPSLVVVDSTGEGMALDGAKPNDDDDTARWFRRLPASIAATGPAVLVLDHVVKADDGGLWPIGSQRKRAAISGAQYMQVTVKPFDRTTAGVAKIVCAKDRHGNYRVGAKVAELHADLLDGDTVTTLALRAASESTTGEPGDWRPTALMERISGFLQTADEPMSWKRIRENVAGKDAHKRTALQCLIDGGHVTVADGARGAKLHTLARGYQQREDPRSDLYTGREQVELKNEQKTGLTCSCSLGGEQGNRSSHLCREQVGTGREQVGNDESQPQLSATPESAPSGLQVVADDPTCTICGGELWAPDSLARGTCAKHEAAS